MKYRAYTPDLEHEHKIIVDTANCGAGAHVSHVPGNRTPAELKADLSVEIALRLAVHPLRHEYLAGAGIVTNDHFDCDGLLATYVLMRPEEALPHHQAIMDASAAGDFYDIGSMRGVQFHHLVEAFIRPGPSPLSTELAHRSRSERNELCTEALLAELPGLLYEPERYREAWEESYRQLLERIDWVQTGRLQVHEYPDERLSVLHTPEVLDDYARNYAGRGHRLLEVIELGGERCYLLNYRVILWYELVSRPSSVTPRLGRLAERLDSLETDRAGHWAITTWRPALRRVFEEPDAAGCVPSEAPLCPSTLALERVVSELRETLRAEDDAARRGAARTVALSPRWASAQRTLV